MATAKVSIQFSSLNDLRTFIRAIDTDVYEISLTRFMITCHCPKEYIDMAVEKQNGKVLAANAQAQKDS